MTGPDLESRFRFDIRWAALMWAAVGPPVGRAAVDTALQVVARKWPQQRTLVTLSVRTAFDAILRALELPAGSPIVMSQVNISDMAAIAEAHHLTIIPVDIDLSTLAPRPGDMLAAQERSGARLCVVAQLYGAIHPIADAAVLRQRGVIVVEDAAQAFSENGYVGDANADVTLFSFGPIKRLTALGGGVAAFRNYDLAERVTVCVRDLVKKPDAWFRKRAIKYCALKLLSQPVAFGVFYTVLTALKVDVDKVIGATARSFAGQALVPAIRWAPADRLMVLMARRIENSRPSLERARITRTFLASLPDRYRIGWDAESHAFWLCPVRVEDPDGIRVYLRSAGFDATRGTTSLRLLGEGFGSNADALMRSVVYLPHPAELNQQRRKELLEAVSSYPDGPG